MKYNGVNHIALATGNIEETVRFWRDLLGMRLIGVMGEKGNMQYLLEISDCCSIVFFDWPGVKPVTEKEHGRVFSGQFAFDHIAFGLESEEELWVLKDRLNAADIWVSEVIDHGFFRSIFSFDRTAYRLSLPGTSRGWTSGRPRSRWFPRLPASRQRGRSQRKADGLLRRSRP